MGLTGKPVADLCGGGAFASRTVDKGKIQRKIEIVETALKKHKIDRSLDSESFQQKDAITILALVGGSEVAALVGAMIEASERNLRNRVKLLPSNKSKTSHENTICPFRPLRY